MAAVSRNDFSRLSANFSAHRGECRHAGRPQHAAPDGDGHGGARADRGRARADDRAPRRRARCRRARHVVGPVHAARLLRGARGNDRARPCAQAPQRRLFHPLTRRVQQSDRGGRRSDRGRRAMRRACRDRALQMLRHGQLGQGRAGAGHDRRRQGARRRRRLRFLSLRRGLEPAEEHFAAMGAGRRRRGHDRAAWRSRNAAKNPRRYRPRRAEQLGPHSVVGLRADLDLAASAAIFRPHHCVVSRRARRRSDRHAVRLSRATI